MSDQTLKAFMAYSAPPARDPAFELAVMARIERRRFHRTIAWTVILAAGACLLFAAAMPMLEGYWRHSFAPFATDPVVAALLLTVTLMIARYNAVRT